MRTVNRTVFSFYRKRFIPRVGTAHSLNQNVENDI